ncbi:hypothetical protein C5167_023221 [Papaver somniferum]|uniref:Uncharacterized protein n=1 Tax=Papaver somniferum TaxID=3469 RepID=A0A4Y7JK49_PAPSO|nr:hypothetical protein C5167_023221 [Papaver somniferum]
MEMQEEHIGNLKKTIPGSCWSIHILLSRSNPKFYPTSFHVPAGPVFEAPSTTSFIALSKVNLLRILELTAIAESKRWLTIL